MPWDIFFKEKIIHILETSKEVLDIGGGLRVDGSKSNNVDASHDYLLPYLKKIVYKVMDPVDTYHPDVVGDIHEMPFPDNSLEAILCRRARARIQSDPCRGGDVSHTQAGRKGIRIHAFFVRVSRAAGVLR